MAHKGIPCNPEGQLCMNSYVELPLWGKWRWRESGHTTPVPYLEEIRYIRCSNVLELQKYPQYNRWGHYIDPTVNLLILTVKCISREHKQVLKTLTVICSLHFLVNCIDVG